MDDAFLLLEPPELLLFVFCVEVLDLTGVVTITFLPLVSVVTVVLVPTPPCEGVFISHLAKLFISNWLVLVTTSVMATREENRNPIIERLKMSTFPRSK